MHPQHDVDLERGVRVVLRDGSEVIIDQIHRTDAPLLVEGFARLSDESRRLRFLTAKDHLSEAELRYFTRVDHHDHEALGALDPSDGRGVGLARYIRDPHDPELAEIAVTVIDQWQGRGLGTELLHRIMDRAAEEGIRRFSALVDADNSTMIQILREIGGELREDGDEGGLGVLEYEIAQPAEGQPNPVLALLRAVARLHAKSDPARDATRGE